MSEEENVIIEEDGVKKDVKIIRHETKEAVKKGISFGSALAMVISFVTWKSVGWAIIHGLFSWVYVIYYIIKYAGKIM